MREWAGVSGSEREWVAVSGSEWQWARSEREWARSERGSERQWAAVSGSERGVSGSERGVSRSEREWGGWAAVSGVSVKIGRRMTKTEVSNDNLQSLILYAPLQKVISESMKWENDEEWSHKFCLHIFITLWFYSNHWCMEIFKVLWLNYHRITSDHYYYIIYR